MPRKKKIVAKKHFRKKTKESSLIPTFNHTAKGIDGQK